MPGLPLFLLPAPLAVSYLLQNLPFPGIFQGLHVLDLGKTKPQWLRDLYRPLDSQHKKSIAELYDKETSDEEEIFNKFKLK